MREIDGRQETTVLLGRRDEIFPTPWLDHDQNRASIGHFWLILKRRARLITVFTLITLATTAATVFLVLRPMYRAGTVILIERNAPQVLGSQEELFSPDVLDTAHDFYKTQDDLLRSHILAAQVILQLGLDHNAAFLQPYLSGIPGWSIEHVRSLYFALFPRTKSPPAENELHVDLGLIDRYLSRLSIQPSLNSRTVRVSFLTSDPVLSAHIANAHAQAYIREGLKLRTGPGEQAEEFLREKLGDIEQKLRESEINLNNYRRKSGLVYLDEGDLASAGAGGNTHRTTVLERLDELSKLMASAEADRIAKEAQAQLVQRHDYDALPDVVESPLVQNLKEQLSTLEGQEASLANTFTPDHPKFARADAQTREVRARLQHEVWNIAAATQAAYLSAQSKEANLKNEMDALKVEAMKLKDAGIEDAILSREVDTNRQLYEGVLQRMKEMGMEAQLRASNVSVIDPAVPPEQPAIPRKALSLVLGLIVGLVGGIGLALVTEYLDNTLETPSEVETWLRLPNLTVVPDFLTMGEADKHRSVGPNGSPMISLNLPDARPANAAALPTLGKTQYSAATEAFRTLCTGIVLSRPDQPPHTMLFTSTRKGEGKSVTVLNTAIAFAQAGRRVLVIDCDLRRSHCHRILGIENNFGLTEVLTGQKKLDEVIRLVIEGQGQGGVYLLTAGSRPPNPGALIGSNRMQQVLDDLREQYDHVLVDTCPIVPMSDALILATLVDGVVVVVEAGKTPRNVVRESVVHLTRVHARLLGIVLNRVDMRHSDYAYYFYRHYSPYYEENAQAAS